MSCLDVLYQPYAAHSYQGKHSSYQTEKSRYGPSRHHSSSSERDFFSRKMNFKSPSEFDTPTASFHPQNSSHISNGKEDKTATSNCLFANKGSPEQSSCLFDKRSGDQNNFSRTNSFEQPNTAPISGPQNNNCGVSDVLNPATGSRIPSSSSLDSGEGEIARRLSPKSDLSSCRLQKRKTPSAHRVSPRCVMFNYFDGSTSDEVDVHFSRALGDESSSVKDSTSPMIKRNFPPSFWNSEYRPPVTHRRFPLPFTAGSALSSLLPGSRPQPNPFSHTARSRFLALDHLTPNFDPYSSSCSLAGIQNHLQHAAAAAAVNNTIGDPWNAYAGLSSSISGHSSFPNRSFGSSAAVSDLYGLSAAAVAAAASHSLDQRYSSLLLQPSAGVRAGASLAAELSAARSSNVMAKEPHLWPVARYSGFRF